MTRYKVRGFAMVPVEVTMFINAKNEANAKKAALRAFTMDPSKYVVHMSEDYACAHDWQPNVEEAA